MLERFFKLSENGTTVPRELLAGVTTFLTMAYIIVVQPAVLSGRVTHQDTGMDFGAVTIATCLAAALATAIMGLYANYPIGQAPGMGENFFFVGLLPAIAAVFPAAAAPWQIALGVVFLSGVLFLALSLFGVREALLEAVSPSMRHGIAGGIGLFIAFIGLRNAGLVLLEHNTLALNTQFASPDLLVFFAGLLLTSTFHALRVRGAIIWGIVAATVLALVMLHTLPHVPAVAHSKVVAQSKLTTDFAAAEKTFRGQPWFSSPREIAATLGKTCGQLDLRRACTVKMAPFVFIFLFMVLFDTLGTLIGVTEQAGLIRDNRLPRARQALTSDAVGTVAGALLGTSTVTSFIESSTGVEQGGRTGLTAVVVALLFLVALVFGPLVGLLGSYPPITAPALVIVGSMMMRNLSKITWDNYAEAMPAFLVILGIPLCYSIADGLALGFIAYPLVKLLAGQGREVKWLTYVIALVLVVYFVMVRSGA
jgi:adenine/guanine/hypoxanthine permease